MLCCAPAIAVCSLAGPIRLIHIQTAAGARGEDSFFCKLFLPLFHSFDPLLTPLNIPKVDDIVLGQIVASNVCNLPESVHFALELLLLHLLAVAQQRCALPFPGSGGGSLIRGLAMTAGDRWCVGVLVDCRCLRLACKVVDLVPLSYLVL